jgi:sporulation protein YtfJ
MGSNIVDMLSAIVGEIKSIAKSETIIGEPVTLGDKTVVPIVKITAGFGAGGGEGSEGDKRSGFGGGGGGGVSIEPAAFLVIDGEKVSLLPAKSQRFEKVFEAIPDILEKIQKLMPRSKKDEGGKQGN